MTYPEKLAVYDEISVRPTSIDRRRIKGVITLKKGPEEKAFNLIFSYSSDIDADRNMAGLILTMPAINFTLFSRKLVLDFPVSDSDLQYLGELVRTNNTEVFINKLVRRRYEFFRKEYLPGEGDITRESSVGVTVIERTEKHTEESLADSEPGNPVAVLSSGGKESLLSYGLLNETGAETHAFYFNESGGHWLTASTAYRHYTSNFPDVHKVWSNVDRFYRFFIRNLELLDQAAVRRRADTYPIQLFIFPVYVMSFIPIALKHGIRSIVLGDEFDDPREMSDYRGIKHYYGIFDQTHDFNLLMTRYYRAKGINMTVWSAVYPIAGSVVEKILINRYPELFRLQRSCHSCRSVSGNVTPCGKCSKCLGILMFTLTAGGNPQDIMYSSEAVSALRENVSNERMRLDSDELELMKLKLGFSSGGTSQFGHVEGVHILPDESDSFEKVPEWFREPLKKIISEYTNGEFRLMDTRWEMQ